METNTKQDAGQQVSADASVQERKKFAVIRIRGSVGVNRPIRDTLTMLNLHRKNYCTVVPATESYRGMLKKVKDYVTYGEIDPETEKQLLEKKGEPSSKKKYEYKPFFRLAPPKGGFERKGIKTSFNLGGALGYRGEKITELIKKMM